MFDWVGVVPDEAYDAEGSEELVGKTIVVSIVYRDAAGEEVARDSYYGTIVSVSREGFRIVAEAPRKGEVRVIPPSVDLVREAEPGRYGLGADGPIVENPDLTSRLEIRGGVVN